MRVLVLLLCLAALSAASVTTFTGERLVGDLSASGADRVRVGTRELALADLDRVVLGEGAPGSGEGGLGVLLADGSWLPAMAIAAATRPDRLAVRSPLGALELPLDAVAGWGDPLPAPGEGDVVVLAGGQVAGRVQGLRDGILRLQSALDPEPLALPVAEVRAARLAVTPRRPTGLRLRAVTTPGRPPLDLVLGAGGVALAALPDVALDARALGGQELRVEGGRRVYLSDLAPAAVREEGMFGVVWPHARDRALDGSPLRLGGVEHAKGLTVHSVAELRWTLARAHLRLRALAGIADQVAPEGDCIAALRGDGRVLWRARLRGGEAPRPLDLDLSGIDELVLTIEAGERHDIGDHVVLADAQVIRKE